MLDYEKSRPEKRTDKAKIAELRGNSPERIRQRKTASPRHGKKQLRK